MKYSGKKQKSHPIRSLLLLTQPSVAILAIIVLLMHWRVSTPVSMTFLAKQLQSVEFVLLEGEMASKKLSLSTLRQLEVNYTAFPKMRTVKLSDVESVKVESLGELSVMELKKNSSTQEVLLRLEGRVSRFTVRHKGIHKDLRMTRFDQLLHSQWAVYGLLAAWIFFTAFGWFKLYQELNRRA